MQEIQYWLRVNPESILSLFAYLSAHIWCECPHFGICIIRLTRIFILNLLDIRNIFVLKYISWLNLHMCLGNTDIFSESEVILTFLFFFLILDMRREWAIVTGHLWKPSGSTRILQVCFTNSTSNLVNFVLWTYFSIKETGTWSYLCPARSHR